MLNFLKRVIARSLSEVEGDEAIQMITDKMERVPATPDPIVRTFIDTDLPELAALAQQWPQLARTELNRALEHSANRFATEPWYRLAQVAIGDASANLPALDSISMESLGKNAPAYLYAVQKIAVHRPLEAAHLARQVFERGDLNTRLLAVRAVVSHGIGDGKLVGEMFVKLMGATTPEEKQYLVEPWLARLADLSTPQAHWLKALCHGWHQESQAIASISTATPPGRPETPTVERAGACGPKKRA